MSKSRAFKRSLFVALSLTALASARCAAPSEAPPTNQPSADAADEATSPTSPSDAAPDAVTCSSDLKADTKNCGRCGHDCLGGGCNSGTCQPIVLAAEQSHPTDIALDATHVYFASPGTNSVFRVPLQGGAVELLTDGATLGSNIAIDDTNVYFMVGGGLANGGVAHVPKSGADGGVPTSSAVAGFPLPFLAIDANSVFWTGGRFGGGPIQGGVYQAAKGGGGTANKIVAAINAETTSVATDDAYVYYASAQGRILYYAKTAAGSPGVLALGQTGATGVVANGTRVYWANAGTGSIVYTEKPINDGGAPTVKVLAGGQNLPARIATDDVAIYFSATGSGTIGSCPLSGCTDVVRLVASDQAAPFGIAVDAVAIYWANSGNGTIMRVAK